MALLESTSAANRDVTEGLNISYAVDQITYDVAGTGTGTKPSYLVAAEQAVANAQSALDAEETTLETRQNNLTAAATAERTAWNAYNAVKTFANYTAWVNAKSTYGQCVTLLRNANEAIYNAEVSLSISNVQLKAAQKKWAEECQTVEVAGGTLIGYEYHRYATGEYKYVGLTRAAAEAAVATLRTYYTRTIAKSSIFKSDGTILTLTANMCPSSIKAKQTDGSMWEVDITISEEDVRVGKTLVTPDTMFTSENLREYEITLEDEEEEVTPMPSGAED